MELDEMSDIEHVAIEGMELLREAT